MKVSNLETEINIMFEATTLIDNSDLTKFWNLVYPKTVSCLLSVINLWSRYRRMDYHMQGKKMIIFVFKIESSGKKEIQK
jgi:hypothetical protein